MPCGRSSSAGGSERFKGVWSSGAASQQIGSERREKRRAPEPQVKGDPGRLESELPSRRRVVVHGAQQRDTRTSEPVAEDQ